MQKEQGTQAIQGRINDTNALLQQQQLGLKGAQEYAPKNMFGTLTGQELTQMRARNSKDFIENINNLTNIKSNSIDELKTINDNIDNVLKLRQQDRTNKMEDLKARLDALGDRISPEQKQVALLKLQQTMKNIDTNETAAVDQAKQIAVEKAKYDMANPPVANISDADKAVQIPKLFSELLIAPTNARVGQTNKLAILKQLSDMGVDTTQISTAEHADKFLSNTTGTAFEHLNMLEDLIKKLPNTNSKLTADISKKILDFFGDPTQVNAEMMQGLAGNELAKFYGANTGGDRAEAQAYYGQQTRDAMLAQVAQARRASSTMAFQNNENYKNVTGVDHPVMKQIQNTIDRKGVTPSDAAPTT